MMRATLQAKIWSAIQSSPFTAADFDVTFGRENQDLLLVVFRHDTRWSFGLSGSYSGNWSLTESPGNHRTTEVSTPKSLDDIPDLLLKWIRNVRDELRTSLPIYSELDELRRALDEHVTQHVSNPEQPFNREEAAELKSKLDDLMARLQQMEEKNQLTEQEVKRLNQEITSLKTNVDSYPKGTWYKTAASKLWATVTSVVSSPEGRKVLTQASQRALGLPSIEE